MRSTIVRSLVAGAALVVIAVAPVGASTAASGYQLVRLVETTSSVEDALAEGDEACASQPWFRYVGGDPDGFATPADPSYPSPNLAAYSTPQTRVGYDTTKHDIWLGDSFDLEDRRTVCAALLQIKVQATGSPVYNDGFHLGHVNNASSAFAPLVASVVKPSHGTGEHLYWLTSQGVTKLNQITSSANPVLDFYLQDDTSIDGFMFWVWYGAPVPTS